MKILDVYGMTETTGAFTANTPDEFKLGTVGRPAAGMEVKIADDGEILVRGPLTTPGYHGWPDLTGALIDAGGWHRRRGEHRTRGGLGSGGRAEPQPAPGRGPHLTARAVRFRGRRSGPCPALASSGLPGWITSASGGRIQGRPRIRHCRACRASGPVLSSVPTAPVRTVPPASRPAGEAL